MNPLIVSPDNFLSTYGGGQIYIKNLVDELVRQGIHPMIAMPGSHGGMPTNYNGCGVYTFDPAARESELEALLSKIKPDVVHAHGYKASFSTVCRGMGIPCLVSAHHGGIVCPAGTLLNADDEICQMPVTVDLCLKCCVKSIPGWRLWYALLRVLPMKLQLWLGERLRRFPFVLFLTPVGTAVCNIMDKIRSVQAIARNTNRVIAPSPAVAEALVRNGIPLQKIVVIPHGIPLPQSQPLRHDLTTGRIRFLYVGRISYVKGLHVLLKAFSSLPSEIYELHILGGAVTKSEQHYLAELKRQYYSANAIWHGSCSHDEVPQYIAQCDVMVHPAICLEVFGLTIAEALAIGRPVIATRCGGAEAQIRDGENGLLIEPNDPSSLRNAVLQLVKMPSLIDTMTKQVGSVISLSSHVKEIIKIYEVSVEEKTYRY